MSGSTMRPWRSVLLVACAALLATQATGLLMADRDSASCVQTCNALRQLCRATCATDCGALYTPGSPQYNACVSACNDVCIDDSQECKFKCNVKKNPPHTPEP